MHRTLDHRWASGLFDMDRDETWSNRGMSTTSPPGPQWLLPTTYDDISLGGTAGPSVPGIPFHGSMGYHPGPYPAPQHFRSQGVSSTGYSSVTTGVPSDTDRDLRFAATLHNRSALVTSPEEVRETYLNLGQVYELSIKDLRPRMPQGRPVRYQSSIRVTFDEPNYREQAAGCWQLWRQGRGSDEARKRGGPVQAIEFGSAVPQERNERPDVKLVNVTLDGFSIIWTIPPGKSPTCRIQFSCNFLSTDFSFSKGIKGASSRLCAKTICLDEPSQGRPPVRPEIRYCKIRAFRDHGAERKFSSDNGRVSRRINKLREKLTQLRSRPHGAPAKRSNSVSSQSSDDEAGARNRPTPDQSSQEADIQSRIATYEARLQSSIPEIVLRAEAGELDDPDLHPLVMDQYAGEGAPIIPQPDYSSHRATLIDTRQPLGVGGLEMASPGPPSSSSSSNRAPGRGLPQDQGQLRINMYSHEQGRRWSPSLPSAMRSDALSPTQQSEMSVSDTSSTVDEPQSRRSSTASGTSWADRVRTARPACIYVRFLLEGVEPDQNFRPVYLYEKSLQGFIMAVSRKINWDASLITQVVFVDSRGLTISVDDDFVGQMEEGQPMAISMRITETSFDSYLYAMVVRY